MLKYSLIVIAVCLIVTSFANAAVTTADHTAVDDYSIIPDNWIDSVQANVNLFFGHQSHGSRIYQGMKIIYDGDNTMTPCSTWMNWWAYTDCGGEELGWNGDTCFVTVIEDSLAAITGRKINTVTFSWCAGAISNSETEMRELISGWKRLATDHDTINFIIQTSRLWDPQSNDSTTDRVTLINVNQYIRDVVEDSCGSMSNVFLYDYADIEMYDRLITLAYDSSASDSGHTWPKAYWDTASGTPPACNTGSPTYDGRWRYSSMGSTSICSHCDNGSWDCYLCSLHGKAWWYLLARIEGWDGQQAVGDTIWYFSKSGSSSNGGHSWSDALLTIEDFNDSVHAGHLAIFGRGVFNDLQMFPPGGGDDSGWTDIWDSVTFETGDSAAPGNRAVISGEETLTNWTLVCDSPSFDVYYSIHQFSDCWSGAAGNEGPDADRCWTGCWNDTLLMKPYNLLDSLLVVADDYVMCHVDISGANDTFYIRVADGVDPADHTVKGSARPAVRFANDNQRKIAFHGMEFRMGKQGVILFTVGANDSIQFYKCIMHKAGHDRGENPAVIMGRAAIFGEDPGPYDFPFKEHLLFENCNIYDAIGCGSSYYEHGGSGFEMYQTRYTVVSSCHVHDVPGNGIIWKNQDALANDSVVTGNVVRNSTIEDCGEFGIVGGNNDYCDSIYGNYIINCGEAAIEPNHGSDATFGNWFICNNTVYRTNMFFWSRFDLGGDSTCVVKYNIFYKKSCDYGFDYYNDWARFSFNSNYYDIDYNMWYDPDSTFSSYCDGASRNWAAWQSTCGFDANGLNQSFGFNTTTLALPDTTDLTMNWTYGGQTWTNWGANQNTEGTSKSKRTRGRVNASGTVRVR